MNPHGEVAHLEPISLSLARAAGRCTYANIDDFRILLQSDMSHEPELPWPAAAQEAYQCMAGRLPTALEHAEFKDKVTLLPANIVELKK